jgi:phosphoribosylformylglycinamidine cyclo-ligase
MRPRSYAEAGVDIEAEETAIKAIAQWCKETFKFRQGLQGEPLSGIGHFANMVSFGNYALVMSSDGVGTKILVAESLGKYDTVGIDLIAMLANDVICVGAEPIAMVDYVAIQKPDEELMSKLGKGLHEGARQANIAIIGGETATLPEMITGIGENSFDIAGTCLGFSKKSELILGNKIEKGDVLIGIESSGIHSNGLTLARKLLPGDFELLIEPTRIYVKPVLEAIKTGGVKGLANITGGGVLNLKRLNRKISFDLQSWGRPMEVFDRLQKEGDIDFRELHRTFNMGIGFCIVSDENHADAITKIISKQFPAHKLGVAVKDGKNEVRIEEEVF